MIIKLFPPQAVIELGHRTNQEDCIYPVLGTATRDDRLFILCDGMGGHERGEVASSAVCQGLSDYFSTHVRSDEQLTDKQLKAALEYAYQLLDEKDTGEYRKAGTTMTLLYFHRGGCTAAHIGDSRIYHFRPSSQSILYKSRDHSLVFELYQAGEISYDEMKTHPRRNQVSKAMIAGLENRQRMDVVHITNILPGDYFLICSDGILERLDDEELLDWLSAKDEDVLKMQKLVELTNGNSDNHSAYLIHVSDVLAEEGDDKLPDDEQKVRFNAIHIHPVLNEERDVRIVADANVEAETTQYCSQPLFKLKSFFKRRTIILLLFLLCTLIALAIMFESLISF